MKVRLTHHARRAPHVGNKGDVIDVPKEVADAWAAAGGCVILGEASKKAEPSAQPQEPAEATPAEPAGEPAESDADQTDADQDAETDPVESDADQTNADQERPEYVAELDVDDRVKKLLSEAGIETTEQLADYEDLTKIKGIGKATAKELLDAIA